MKNVKKMMIAAAFCTIAGGNGYAFKPMANGCAGTETAQVTINFNGTDKDVTAVKTKLDGKVAEIKALADEQHFTKFTMQSHSYNINSNFNAGYGSEPQFQYNGSTGFMIQPADKAVDFMVLLTKKGYQASVSVSSYNNGGCTQERGVD